MVQAALPDCPLGLDEQSGNCHGVNGSIVTKSEIVFDGQFEQGYVHGKATVHFADDASYEGSVVANVISGTGVMTYDGYKYHGELENGLFHGKGTLTVACQGSSYQGGFPVLPSAVTLGLCHLAVQALPQQDRDTVHPSSTRTVHVFGYTNSSLILQCSSAGMWASGLRHGHGTWTDGTGANRYTGEWRHDQRHGWGIMQYPSGGVFEGEWAYDKKHGFGTMYWTAHMERYRGNWEHNAPHGVGEHTYFAGLRPSEESRAFVIRCNRYIGMMRSGKRDGEGCMLYGSGAAAVVVQGSSSCRLCSGTRLTCSSFDAVIEYLLLQVRDTRVSGIVMPSMDTVCMCLKTTRAG